MSSHRAIAHLQRALEIDFEPVSAEGVKPGANKQESLKQKRYASPIRYNPYKPSPSPTVILPMQINFDEENQEIQFVKPTFDEITYLFEQNDTCLFKEDMFERTCLINLIKSGKHNAIYALKSNSLQGVAFLEQVRNWPPGREQSELFMQLAYPCTVPERGVGSAMFDYARLQATKLNCGLYNRAVAQSEMFWKKMYERLDKSKWVVQIKGPKLWAYPLKPANHAMQSAISS